MSRDAKSVIRKYFLVCGFSAFVLFALFITLIVVFHSIWMWTTIAFVLVFCAVERIVIRKIANHYIHSILFQDLDAEKYKEVLTGSKFFFPPAFCRLMGAYCSGDYQTTVDICEKWLRGKLKPRNAFFCLSLLACVYFETRNFEELKTICDRYQAVLSQLNGKNLKDTPLMYFMQLYSNGDYDACKKLIEEGRRNERAWILQIIRDRLYYAVVVYELGQTEEARSYFAEIMERAPKLNYASLAKRYIDAIDSSDKSALAYPKLIPNPNYVLYTPKQLSVRRGIRVVRYVLLGVLLAASIYSVFSSNSFDRKLNDAIKAQNASYQLIDYFPIMYEDKSLAIMCLVSASDGLTEGYVGTYDNGKTLSFLVMEEKLKVGTYYFQRAGDSDFYIGFQIYEEKESLPEDSYKTIEYEIDGDVRYFCIEYIVKLL